MEKSDCERQHDAGGFGVTGIVGGKALTNGGAA
jgi:hypothetical protein